MRRVILVAAVVAPPALAAADPPRIAVRGRAELIASAGYQTRAGDATSAFTLDRAEAGGRALVDGRGTAELVVEAVRSAQPDSFAGIDGNSILVRVKRAGLGARTAITGEVTVELALGLVGDPWIEALGDYPLRTLGVALAEDAELVASSDLGLAAHATIGVRVRLAAAITNGEGAHQVERNDGKDTAVAITVTPPLPAAAGALAITAYGRDGSVGPGSTRSHRAGAAIAWHHRRAAAGVDLLRAWGVGPSPDRLALAVEAWADLRALDRAGLSARWDRLDLDGPTQDLRRWRATAALWYAPVDELRVLAAIQVERAAGADAAVPGVPAATDATRVTLTVQGSLEGAP